MKTYCKLVDFHCDFQKDSWECHSQFQSVLQWWEPKTVAHKQVKEIGWILGKHQDCCPYCKDHLSREERVSLAYFRKNKKP